MLRLRLSAGVPPECQKLKMYVRPGRQRINQLIPLPFNPFNASCSKLLLFEAFGAILV